MSIQLHTEMVQKAAANNIAKFGQADNRLLKIESCRKMQDLVNQVVERQVDAGALDHLNTQELQLLVSRVNDLTADDFKLVEAIVEALVPKPTGETISLEDEGINVPEDKQ